METILRTEAPVKVSDIEVLPRASVDVCKDGELIRRIGERDSEAFKQLYRRFARPVLGVALRRLEDRGRAEDAMHETFAAIWRSAATYRPDRGPAAPWLFAVARNAIVNQTRMRTEPPMEVPDSASHELAPQEHAAAAAQYAPALAATAYMMTAAVESAR
jgi:RNA polymerase sigma-70 factor, ECF subfamily